MTKRRNVEPRFEIYAGIPRLKAKRALEKLGIFKLHLCKIESGKKTLTLALLKHYASVFEVAASSILFLSENIDNDIDPEKTGKFLHPKILTMMNFVFLKKNNRSNR